jgi:hypothetical protein
MKTPADKCRSHKKMRTPTNKRKLDCPLRPSKSARETLSYGNIWGYRLTFDNDQDESECSHAWASVEEMKNQREKECMERKAMEEYAKENPLFYSEESFMEWLESLTYSHVDTQE